ncbi:MAG: ABC transporter permease [Defluviitaleaceae bacterium]|nr:ABC transporter permease [Defluviitaleaceae bacterium]
MFLIKNALHNLRRNIGRNILMAVILFAIIATTAVALIINNTANAIIGDYEYRFGSRVNIVPDTARIMENMREAMGGMFGGMGGMRQGIGNMNPQVTAQQSIAFAQLPYVHTYEMTASQLVFGGELSVVDGDEEAAGGMFVARGAMGGVMGDTVSIDSEDTDIPNMRLYGNYWEDFENGLRNIVEGQFPTATGEALISMEMAELNGLAVGDTFRVYGSLTSIDGEDITSRTVIRELTVSGIYFDMTPENPMGGFVRLPLLNRRNEVLTTLDTLLDGIGENESGVTVTAVYYLHEPALLPDFEAAARGLGLSDLLLVTTNEAEYLAIVEPVIGLRGITSTFMYIVLILGGVVLAVLASISVRERKYEIGVLRAMGMKKKKLALGLLTEMFAMTAACLALGLLAGSVAAQPVSDRLLASQLESIAAEEAKPGNAAPGGMMGMFGGGINIVGGGMSGRFGQLTGANTPEAVPLSELDVSLGVRPILEIAAISLLLAALAGAVSVIRITRYEPMKILMERN